MSVFISPKRLFLTSLLAFGLQSAHAQLIDAGDVIYTAPHAHYSYTSPDYIGDSLWQYSVIHNGFDLQVGQTVGASSFSGYSDANTMTIDLDAWFQPDAGLAQTGYKVTVSGYVMASGNATVSLNSYVSGAAAVKSSSWSKIGYNDQAFSVSQDFLTTDASASFSVWASAGANYSYVCYPDDPFSCTYSQGSTSLTITDIQVQAVVSSPTPAVPEPEGAWLAFVALGVLSLGRRAVVKH